VSATKQKIDVPCPQCKSKLAVPVAAMGKSGKCPHCGNVFPLAMPAQRPAAPAPAPSLLTPLSPVGGADLGLTPLGGGDLMPLTDAELTPLPAASSFAPLASGNPFTDAVPQGDYTLQPMAPAPYVAQTPRPTNASLASEYMANASASYDESKSRKYYGSTATDEPRWGINAGIGGGAIMMLIALVWFCGGLAFGILFFYPPILFVVGIIAFFKGIFDNFSA
jgi:hypothetical protein